MTDMTLKTKVCILGAGAAGLAAAHRFVSNGMTDFIVIEAQNRVGGRILTADYGNHVIEYGAHWIHGEDGNVIFDWASKSRLVEEEQTFTQTGQGKTKFVHQNGEIVDSSNVETFNLVAANMDEEAAKEFSESSGDLGTFITEKFKSINPLGDLGMQMLEWLGRYKSILDGSDNWFEVSAPGQDEYYECPGNPVVNWKTGYSTLLNHFKESLNSSQLLLNSPVVKVYWNSKTETQDHKCRIVLESGSEIQAESIICTFPLSVLKKCYQTMFRPELPLVKAKAIEGLDINVVDKIYLQFQDSWWGDADGFSILRNLESIDNSPSPENWEESIVGFYETFKQPGMLCAWITGRAALAMEETPLDEVASRCVAYLRKLLSLSYCITQPIWYDRSTWGKNPYILGSYSYRSVKTHKMDVWASDLAGPCDSQANNFSIDEAVHQTKIEPSLKSPSPKSPPVSPLPTSPLYPPLPALTFAGEATHDHYYSTVHGAVESGWREADRIIGLAKNSMSKL